MGSEYGRVAQRAADNDLLVTTNDAQRVPATEQQPAGLAHGLQEGDIVIRVAVAGDETKAAAFTKSKDAPQASTPGQTVVYSAAGAGVSIVGDGAGKVAIYNGTQDMFNVITMLLDALVGMQTAGSPANHIVAPTSLTQFEAVRAAWGQLMERGTSG